MKSKTSFFSRTVFHKNVSLYWPIWVCYLLYGMIKVPGMLWFRLQQNWKLTDAARYQAVYESLRLQMDVYAIACMAVITGMALFGYLFTQKNAYMIHALPVTRLELFATNVISGLGFFFVPQFVVFLTTVLLCLAKGIACVQFLGLWLLSVMGISFFLYAVVCFCAMFTGQLFALPVYFVAVNYMSLSISTGIRYVIGFLGYGLSMEMVSDYPVFRILSPMDYLYNHVKISREELFDQAQNVKAVVLHYSGGGVLAAYVFAGAALYLLAYYGYKKRRIESAGDLLTFDWLKPLFRWGVGLCFGYFSGVFAAEFLDSVQVYVKGGFLYLLVAAFGILGFIVAQMLIEKGFRVFRRRLFAECGAFLLVVLGSLGLVSAKAASLQQYLPKEEDVAAAYIYMNYPAEYKGAEVKTALAIQKKILAYADIFQEDHTDETTTVRISYRLKNKKMVSRSYQIPAGSAEGEAIGTILSQQEYKVDNFMYYLIGSDYDQITEFDAGMLLLDTSSSNYESVNFDRKTAKKLYQAMLADAEAQTLQKYNLYNSLWGEDAQNYASAGLTIDYAHASLQWEDIYQRTDDSYSSWGEENENMLSGTIYLSFGEDCTRIIQTLIDCGVVSAASDIRFTVDEETQQ